jgi:hypothetical protein
MLILTIIIVTVAIFVTLAIIAGIKGFFKGVGEELMRQHGVITRVLRKLKARNLWRKRRKSAKGLPKEGAQDIDAEI